MSTPPAKPVLPVHWVLWIAYPFSVMIFGFVGFYTRSAGETPEGADAASMVISGGALVLGLTASLVITMGTPYAAKLLGNHQIWLILRLALAEAPVLMGFVGFYMGGTSIAFLAMLAWGLGLMMLSMPTVRDIEAWNEQRKQVERTSTRR